MQESYIAVQKRVLLASDQNKIDQTRLKTVFVPLLVQGDSYLDRMKHFANAGDSDMVDTLSIRVGGIIARIEVELHEPASNPKSDGIGD